MRAEAAPLLRLHDHHQQQLLENIYFASFSFHHSNTKGP